MGFQRDWRFCSRCNSLFFDGAPDKGRCPSGGAHAATGFNFEMPFDVPETANDQGAWRFCEKCRAMFFDGAQHKGACPAGGGHVAEGLVFVIKHDVPEPLHFQGAWRHCEKCRVLFFDGFQHKGACTAGGGHTPEGFVFLLPHTDDVQVFESGPIHTDDSLAVGGSARLVISRSGAFGFSTHAHGSGFSGIDYTLSAVLLTPKGLPFSFTHAGHVEGTADGLPLGTPDRDDNQSSDALSVVLRDEYNDLFNSRFVGAIGGSNTLVSVEDLINVALTKAAGELGVAAGKAVAKLVVPG
jgi:hypothetical protein